MNVDDPRQISDLVSSHLSIKVERKQRLLEMVDPEKSLKFILKLLLEEIDILQLEHDIQDKVRQEVERGHKEYYLREQLKIIQDELGQNETPSEIEELRGKIEEADRPGQTGRVPVQEDHRLPGDLIRQIVQDQRTVRRDEHLTASMQKVLHQPAHQLGVDPILDLVEQHARDR